MKGGGIQVSSLDIWMAVVSVVNDSFPYYKVDEER